MKLNTTLFTFLLLAMATGIKAQNIPITATDLISKAACANKACADEYAKKIKYKLESSVGDTILQYRPITRASANDITNIEFKIWGSVNRLRFMTQNQKTYDALFKAFVALGYTTNKPAYIEMGGADFTAPKYPKCKLIFSIDKDPFGMEKDTYFFELVYTK